MSLSSINKKQIQKFGLIALFFFGCLLVLGLWKQEPFLIYLFGFLNIICFGFILIPQRTKPIYESWMKLGQLFAKISITLVLTIFFFAALTPFALVKRFLSGPTIPLKPDKKASSYWVDQSEMTQSKERFYKQY